MPNLIEFYKGNFLHVIPAGNIVPCYNKNKWNLEDKRICLKIKKDIKKAFDSLNHKSVLSFFEKIYNLDWYLT